MSVGPRRSRGISTVPRAELGTAMNPIRNRIIAALLVLTVGPGAAAQVPGLIAYEGYVTSGGAPFQGAGQFKFALVSGGGSGVTSYWSQDGTSLAGSEPASSVLIAVSDGRFSALLGDVLVPGMMAIEPEVFDHPDVRLRIWFNDGVNGWAQLAPDQRLTPAGYAFRAAGTPAGAITSGMLAPSSVTSASVQDGALGTQDLADNTVTTAKLAAGSVTPAKLAANAVTTPKIAAAAVTGDKLAPGIITAAHVAPNAIGSGQIADVLDLRELTLETASGLHRIELSGGGDSGILRMNQGQIGRFLEVLGNTSGGQLRLFDKLGGELTGQTTVELGSSEIGGYARIYQDTGGAGVQINGQNGDLPGGTILLYRENGLGVVLQGQNPAGGGGVSVRNNAGNETVAIVGSENNNPGGQITVKRQDGHAGIVLDGQLGSGGGQVSIRNGAGAETIQMLGNEASDNQGGQITIKRDDGHPGIVLDGQLGSGGGDVLVRNAAGDTTVRLQGTEGAGTGDGAGQIQVSQPDGQVGVLIDGQAGNLGGQVAINNVAGQTRVNIVGQTDSGGGYVGVRDASGTVTAQISGAEVNGQGAQITLAKSDGTPTIFLDAELGSGGGSIRVAKSDGTVPIKIDASASGGGRVTTQVLEITGGSDLSEQFDISPGAASPEPGTLLCIDPEHAGRLVPSARAYDTTVAGVLSGAGGVRTGLVMGQAGSEATGSLPVALTGRVYCRVDAAYGSIRPGDLLTTSNTPGHAMKASNPDRARGAILGKAMTPLNSGRGLVLVLVALQ